MIVTSKDGTKYKKVFAVVHYSEDFVQCIGVYGDYYKAVGRAYDFAADIAEDKGTVSTLWELEGETGLGITITRKEDGDENKDIIYILENDDEKVEEGGQS